MNQKNNKKVSLEFFQPGTLSKTELPLYEESVPAGFPSPAEDYIDKKLDLNEHLIRHPASTFFVRVSGHSMLNAGILDGDILVVDRSLEASDKKIVVCILDGEFTVKRIRKKSGKITLLPENDQYSPIEITAEMDFRIWGVVTYAIHKI